MSFPESERRASIAFLRTHPFLRERQHADFLEWLFEQQLGNPEFRVSYRKIYEDFFKKGAFMKRGSPLAPPSGPLPKALKVVLCNFVDGARKYVERCYRESTAERRNPAPPNQALPYVDIFSDVSGKISSDGRITLRFLAHRPVPMADRRAARQTNKSFFRPQNDPAWMFWKGLLRSTRGPGIVIYSNEQPEIAEELESKLDGNYSGSCEPAAAFLIGQCIAHQHVQFSAVRSKIVFDSLSNEKERHLSVWKTKVFLGSSVVNTPLKRLRKEQPWADRQTFHFELEPGGEVVLFKGPLGIQGKRWASSPRTEFALISYFKTGREVLIGLAGNRSIGTWAAAKALCDRQWITQFLQYMKFTDTSSVPSFEAVLQVHIEGNSPETFEVVDHTIHMEENPHKPTGT